GCEIPSLRRFAPTRIEPDGRSDSRATDPAYAGRETRERFREQRPESFSWFPTFAFDEETVANPSPDVKSQPIADCGLRGWGLKKKFPQGGGGVKTPSCKR